MSLGERKDEIKHSVNATPTQQGNIHRSELWPQLLLLRIPRCKNPAFLRFRKSITRTNADGRFCCHQLVAYLD